MGQEKFVIGLDFGTDSVRTLIVNARTGEEVSSALHHYTRWKQGLFCDPSRQQYRQHPLDYVEGLEASIKKALLQSSAGTAENIVGISVDTTGSTPVAVNKHGVPLAMLPEFDKNPNAMFVLWKDHTSTREAAEINNHAGKYDVNYLKYVGGIYSSEWFWAKLLHVLRADGEVRKACHSWVEHCDWIPFLLTGGADIHAMKRGVCSAGHKALWSREFGGLPPENFFSTLDPLLKGFNKRLFKNTETSDQPAGKLSKEWANRLGLSPEVVVGVGAFDAHMGAVGGQIEPYHLSKVMGTSTCDMLVAPQEDMNGKLVKGICGQVDGSIIPGMIGLEAGQSAFGDTYAWFRSMLMGPMHELLAQSSLIKAENVAKLQEELNERLIPELTKKAEAIPVEETGELAIDWLNGRRTPDANQEVRASISGLHLGSDAARIFKALVESTCFGAKAIAERFASEGVPVKGLIGLGGVARKSPYIMQVMADVMNMPIRIHKSEQTCALGAAMFAATAAGIHSKVEEAMVAMGPGFDAVYKPNSKMTTLYAKRYQRFKNLGNFVNKHE